jgi:hypothetical protein
MRSLTLYSGILVAFSISFPTNPVQTRIAAQHQSEYKRRVGQISPPKGYTRPIYPANSFTMWLRNLPLRSDSTIYLYNGREKLNQSAQFAVIDLPIGSGQIICARPEEKMKLFFWIMLQRHTNLLIIKTVKRMMITLKRSSIGAALCHLKNS